MEAINMQQMSACAKGQRYLIIHCSSSIIEVCQSWWWPVLRLKCRCILFWLTAGCDRFLCWHLDHRGT